MRALAALLVALIVALGPVLSAGPLHAQDVAESLDYESWEKDATRAEEVLEAGRASNDALEILREAIVAWRSQFLAAQSANDSRIATIRDQIAALGPAPAEGETEAAEIAKRRAELNDQLARLQAPGLAAVEAHSRADGIIREIDAVIRARQADEILRLYPTPLDPSNWPAAFTVLTDGTVNIVDEVVQAWQNPVRRSELNDNLPVILLYLAVAGALVLRGGAAFQMMADRLSLGGSKAARRLSSMALSLGQVVLPVGGMFLFVQALEATHMAGSRSAVLIAAFPPAALALFSARWLGGRLFGRHGLMTPILPEGTAGQAWLLVNALGILGAIELLRRGFVDGVRPALEPEAQAVWDAPVVAVAAIFLLRIGLLLRRSFGGEPDDGETVPFRDRLGRLVGTATVAAAFLGLVLALVGYVVAANALVWPMCLTLALIGVLALLQRVVGDLYAVVTRDHDETMGDALIPVLMGFALFFLALPLFALIWGARVADLAEVWTRVQEGFEIGDTRISPQVFLTFAVVFVVGYTATRLLQGALRSSILPKTKLDKGGQNAVTSGVGYLGIFLAAIIAVSTAGIDLSSLAIVAGALSVGIGFGLQNIVSNFVSGIILLIERPVSEGDWIEVGGKMGIVKSISVRSTRIETFDRTEVIVPNADLVSGTVTNWTRSNLNGRLVATVGVAYGTDTRKVEKILSEVAMAHPLVVVNPPPSVTFEGFGADSLNFTIRAILRDVNFILSVQSEVNHEIARRFAEEGIEIPFAQRDLHIRNPEALAAAFAARADGDQVSPEATEEEAGPAPTKKAKPGRRRRSGPEMPEHGEDDA